MKTLLAIMIVGACALGSQYGGQPKMDTATAKTYEHLATAIIEIRAVEDNLVRGILLHHGVMVQWHLDSALDVSGRKRAAQLEDAAEQMTNIANEGGRAVQAIRQRLLKAGHHHHTDAETQEDYMFVDSGEKKELLDLARTVSKLGRSASDEQIRDAGSSFDALFDRVIAPE